MAQLDNQGTLDVGQALTLARADADHLNSGTIDLTAANLTLTQTGTTPSFTNTSTGTVTLGASRTWTVSGGGTTINSFTPAIGNSFTIMLYGSRTGSFGTVNLPPLGAGTWLVT